jgi:hypothetical protein
MGKSFEVKEGFICPACSQKRLNITIWYINRSFTYYCNACDKIKPLQPPVVVIFGKEDMLTDKFLQNGIDTSWKLVMEMQKRMKDDNNEKNA